MVISSRTPEGTPNHCPICGNDLRLEPSRPTLDAPCPHCGHLLWFAAEKSSLREQRPAGAFKETELVLTLLTTRFGMLPPAVRAAIEAIGDPERLRLAAERALSARSLDELVDNL